MNTNDLVRLAADLWPRWTITESIADLMVRKFEELEPDCVEQAIRDHRLNRSTVPDIGVIVSSAKALSDARRAMAAHTLAMQACTPRQRDMDEARHRLGEMDEVRRLWLWRYCREMARLTETWEAVRTWPDHWQDPAPPLADWPRAVLAAYHAVHVRLGV